MEGIRNFLCLIGADSFWGYLLIALTVLWAVLKCLFPWKPCWKSKKTKDKDGNDITVYYHLDK